MKDLWTGIDPEKKSDYSYLDSLWLDMYIIGKHKSKVLKWVKAKKIFTRRYVFIHVVYWGHWSLLVLCNFDETNYLGTPKGPHMLLLDSLRTTQPKRLPAVINSFIIDILKTEEREERGHKSSPAWVSWGSTAKWKWLWYICSLLYIGVLFSQNRKTGRRFEPAGCLVRPRGTTEPGGHPQGYSFIPRETGWHNYRVGHMTRLHQVNCTPTCYWVTTYLIYRKTHSFIFNGGKFGGSSKIVDNMLSIYSLYKQSRRGFSGSQPIVLHTESRNGSIRSIKSKIPFAFDIFILQFSFTNLYYLDRMWSSITVLLYNYYQG